MAGLDPAWAWLILALALGIAEMVVPGVFLIWLSGAALVTGLVTLGLDIAAPLQFALFACVAVAAVYGGRRYLIANPIRTDDPLLNERAARLVGEQVVVCQPIVAGEGRVRLGDGEWIAEGDDTPAGTRMRIIGLRGNRLLVAPIE